MFNRLKKIVKEIKTDIDHKIDHLEAKKDHIVNKTQRTIDQKLSLNGVDFFLRKEESLFNLQKVSRENEQLAQEAEKEIQLCFVRTTNLQHGFKNFEKDFVALQKSLDTVKQTLDKLEKLCTDLNGDLNRLEDAVEEKEVELATQKLQRDFDKYCSEKQKELTMRELENQRKQMADEISNSADGLEEESEETAVKSGQLIIAMDNDTSIDT